VLPLALPARSWAEPSAIGPHRPAWTAHYGPDAEFDSGKAIAVSPDGRWTYAAGRSNGITNYDDYATIAYEAATGRVSWVARYAGEALEEDEPSDLVVSEDGSRVYVTGESEGVDTGEDYATVAYEAMTGHQLWASRYDASTHKSDRAFAMALSPDGTRLYVTGESDEGTYDYLTVAYDVLSGQQIAAVRYSDPSTSVDTAVDIAVSPDGQTLFVSGHSYVIAEGGYDYTTVAYRADDLSESWVARYDGSGGWDTVARIVVSPVGDLLYVTGASQGPDGMFDLATVAYSTANGSEQWVARATRPGLSDEQATAVQTDAQGTSVFVTGSSFVGGDSEIVTLAYEASTGEERWRARFDRSTDGYETPADLQVSNDGHVFVAARTPGGLNFGDTFLVLGYETGTGILTWMGRYGRRGLGSGPDSMALDPDGGGLFITGYSWSTDYRDMATVAYALPGGWKVKRQSLLAQPS
jgi:WD40 repeat protein